VNHLLFTIYIFCSTLFGLNLENTSPIKMKYSFEKIENEGSYKIDILNLNTEILIIGKPTSGAKIIVYFDSIIKEKQNLKKQLQVYNDEKNRVLTIKDSKNDEENKKNKIILQLPKNINLKIKSCVDHLAIDNISGFIIINNQSGTIDINNIIGDLDIIAAESEINIKNSRVNCRLESKGFNLMLANIVGKSNISSFGGDVSINRHQGDLSIYIKNGNLSVKELNGEFSNFKSYGELILIEDAQTDIHISNQLGNLYLRNIRGVINADTDEGNIYIDNYYGNLLADTNSGDIYLGGIIGSTDVSSRLGNVTCIINYESSFKNSYHSIQTLEGDINLTIPKKLSLSLTSQIAHNRSTQYITSEIPLNFSLEDDKIVGKAVMNDGKIPITIYSKNGFIDIKNY